MYCTDSKCLLNVRYALNNNEALDSTRADSTCILNGRCQSHTVDRLGVYTDSRCMLNVGYPLTDNEPQDSTRVDLTCVMNGQCRSYSVDCLKVYKDSRCVVNVGYALEDVAQDSTRMVNVRCAFTDNEASHESVDPSSYALSLRWCGSKRALKEGRLVHVAIIAAGLQQDTFLGNLLVQMYGRCGTLEEAHALFAAMQCRNVFSWTIMIGMYVQKGQYKEAFELFLHMQLDHVMPNAATFVIMLTACSNEMNLSEGVNIHAQILRAGLISDVTVGNALVSMYGKCSSLEDAERLFNTLPSKNTITYNVMISTYGLHQAGHAALLLFQHMEQKGIILDKATYLGLIDASLVSITLLVGKHIHLSIVESGFDNDCEVGTSLLNMYAKCSCLENAQRMFRRLHQVDAVSWTSMITAFANYGYAQDALKLSQLMILDGKIPDNVTFTSILDACASLAALAEGRHAHACIVEGGFEFDIVIGTALVDMYGKCGSIDDALRVFEKIPNQNVVLWNALIGACGQNGHETTALQFFGEMQQQGLTPNEVTFFSVLCACRHAGLVAQGYHHFASMTRAFCILPTVEHYNCMIDLFGRAGQLDEVEDLIDSMPHRTTISSWMTLLGACRMHLDVERGKRAAFHVLNLDPENGAAYVSIYNVYSVVSL